MILEAYACSDMGAERSKNEDNLYFNGLIKEEAAESFKHYEKMNIKKSRAAFGVFDGMGGYSRGEYAAYVTAGSAKSILMKNRSGNPEELLKTICTDANSKVCDEKIFLNQKMGSTLSMLYFENSSYFLCDIGDSPVYMMRKGNLKKISLEHTEASAYEKIYGEAPPKGKKFPLTQHIGISENLARLNPYYKTEFVQNGDIFLICSDGLTDMLDDAEISRIINSNRPLSGIGKILLNNALNKGGKDNITFVLIKVADVKETKNEIPKREKSKSWSDKESVVANKKVSVREKNLEGKAIFKIIVGTIIFVVVVAAVSFWVIYSHPYIYNTSVFPFSKY